MPLGTRLFGMCGVAMVAVLILSGAFFTWTVFRPVKEPSHLSLFDVAPPAAPPEPVNETPPQPEQVRKERVEPLPEQPKQPPAEIQLPADNVLPVPVVKPVADPSLPVKNRTAAETRPQPPAPEQNNAKPTWEGMVLGALNKVKRYPRNAALRRQQGVPYIRFVMDREGKLLSSRIERSSGFRALDDEAVALPKRAQPLPKPPAEVKGDTIELIVPVEFFMR
ncbi:energy transducer TonB [Sphingobium lactosutens]|uniref:energy transducer TonB family protein n=1 Tax=Sphingobium lactosutens TaxID=522773 RepID=UPI0015C155CA|nr:TonB family protein [Sphingobium lactosutens]NWK95820.1 energy transducer TonB [Sphingobium lactosutens]